MNRASAQYDIIKVVTTFLVVAAHAARMYTGEGVVQPYNSSAFLSSLCNIIYDFHMPLYICVSGMVYGLCVDDYKKYGNTLEFIKNKFLRLLIPYWFFGIIYVAPVMVLFRFTESSYLEYCISGILLVRDSRHLWYLVVLFGIFCICALIKKQMQKWNSFIMFAVFLIILAVTWKLPNVFQIKKIIYYLPFFYLGYIINRNYEKITGILKRPIVMILLAAAFVLSHLLPAGEKAAASLCGIGIAAGAVQYVDLRICSLNIFKKINKNGFGIYLLHPMIIYVLFYYLGKYDINPVLLCGGIILVSYVVSYVLTNIIRKTRLKAVIGE